MCFRFIALIALFALPVQAALGCDPTSDNRKMAIEYRKGFFFVKTIVGGVDHYEQILQTGDDKVKGIFVCGAEKYNISIDYYLDEKDEIDAFEDNKPRHFNEDSHFYTKKAGPVYAHIVLFGYSGKSAFIFLCAKPGVYRFVKTARRNADGELVDETSGMELQCENRKFRVRIRILEYSDGYVGCYISTSNTGLEIDIYLPDKACDIDNPERTVDIAVALLSYLGMLDPKS
jgi:hypothetical protein